MLFKSQPRELPPLYDYQSQAIDELRKNLARGVRRQVLCAATGSGKTVVAMHMIASALTKQKRALFVVDRRSLLEQTCRRLQAVGIDHGVIAGGASKGVYKQLLVGMTQTLSRRGWPEHLDVMFIDECHSLYTFVKETIHNLPCPVIGLTATPMIRGLGRLYQQVVQVITNDQLVEQGKLAPLRIETGREVDMTGAKQTAGEWQANEVTTRCRPILGDIVSTWIRRTTHHFGKPVKTMVFSSSIAHGEELCSEFQNAGYDFRQYTANTPEDEAAALMTGFSNGEFIGIVSVDALAKGVDVPDVQCLVIARPYRKSLAAHIQMLGRGQRSSAGKEFCLVLDHVGNCLGFYDQTAEFWSRGIDDLNDEKFLNVKRSARKKSEVECAGCQAILPPAATQCPVCGRERKRRNTVIELPGEMVNIDSLVQAQNTLDGSKMRLWLYACTHASRIHPRDEQRAKILARVAFKNVAGIWPAGYDYSPGEIVPNDVQRRFNADYRKWRRKQRVREIVPA